MNYIVSFDPVILSLGPVQIRWYSMMYIVGFLIAGHLCKILVRRNFFQVAEEKIDSLVVHMMIGMVIVLILWVLQMKMLVIIP